MKPRISYDGYLATSLQITDLLTADEWREYARTSGSDASVYDRYGASTDWFDEITRNGFSQNHSLSLAGGSSSSNYRASVNYQKSDGIMKDNDMDRYNFRFQLQQRAINDRLRIGLTGSANMRDFNQPNRRNFVLAYNMLPVYQLNRVMVSGFDTREYDQGNRLEIKSLNHNFRKNIHFMVRVIFYLI